MRSFHTASDREVKLGETTDIYFVRTRQVLNSKGLENTPVVAEVTANHLPENWPWGILCGVHELAHLFEDTPVNIFSMPEGSVLHAVDSRGLRVPIMRIEGPYGKFCVYETALLGLICQASGIASRAARMRKVAGDKQLVSFGIRRMHPCLSPMIDRAAFIGGFDAVSSLKGAEATETDPVGTMPHALIIIFGDQVAAWTAFDEVVEDDVPRVALVDTYSDEKMEAILASKALRKLRAVRLDTPSSRRGDFAEIVREVRWELDLRGFKSVEIFISGGLDEDAVKRLRDAGADAFGVGTYVSNSPTINFAMDIVEADGRLCAKRGKFGGRKEVWRCSDCMVDIVQLYSEPQPKCPRCSRKMASMLQPLIRNGKLVAEFPKPKEIRRYVLEQLRKLALE